MFTLQEEIIRCEDNYFFISDTTNIVDWFLQPNYFCNTTFNNYRGIDLPCLYSRFESGNNDSTWSEYQSPIC